MARYGCTGRIGSTRVAKLSELYLLWTCHGSFTGSSAMRSQRSQEARALSSPSHSSCACVNVWGRLKSLVLQLSRSSAVFPRQADHINWLSCLGKKELGGGGGFVSTVFCLFLSFSYARMNFCFDFHLALISPPPPSLHPRPLRIVCYFFLMLTGQWYERDLGPPYSVSFPCTL